MSGKLDRGMQGQETCRYDPSSLVGVGGTDQIRYRSREAGISTCGVEGVFQEPETHGPSCLQRRV